MTRVISFLIIIISLGLLSGCGRIESFRETLSSRREEMTSSGDIVDPENVATVFAVNTTRAVEGQILDYLEVNGDVVTRSSIDIFADTAGKLTKLAIRLGDTIEKDQIIAEVDPSRPGMKFVVSPVKSPIAGTIIDIPAQVGATITQGFPIAKVSRMDDLQIRTEVSERFISKIRVGLTALLHFEAYPEVKFWARITELDPVVDPRRRTMGITMELWTEDSRIKSGMFAEVKIITDQKAGIVKVPAECLVKRYGGYYVFVINNGTAEKRKVTPGILIDNKLEITEGLEPDEEVVIRGQTLLEEGSHVKVIDRIMPLTAEDVIE